MTLTQLTIMIGVTIAAVAATVVCLWGYPRKREWAPPIGSNQPRQPVHPVVVVVNHARTHSAEAVVEMIRDRIAVAALTSQDTNTITLSDQDLAMVWSHFDNHDLERDTHFPSATPSQLTTLRP